MKTTILFPSLSCPEGQNEMTCELLNVGMHKICWSPWLFLAFTFCALGQEALALVSWSPVMLIFTVLTGCSLGTRESLGVEEGVNFKCSGLSSQQLSVGAPASTYSFRISFPLLVRKRKELRKEDLNLCGGEKQESSRQASELGLSILGPRAPVWTLGLRTPWKGNKKVCEYGAWFSFLLPGKRFHKFTKISKEFLKQEG